jgi:hypothetical protein
MAQWTEEELKRAEREAEQDEKAYQQWLEQWRAQNIAARENRQKGPK